MLYLHTNALNWLELVSFNHFRYTCIFVSYCGMCKKKKRFYVLLFVAMLICCYNEYVIKLTPCTSILRSFNNTGRLHFPKQPQDGATQHEDPWRWHQAGLSPWNERVIIRVCRYTSTYHTMLGKRKPLKVIISLPKHVANRQNNP